jgi:hypothetical protein
MATETQYVDLTAATATAVSFASNYGSVQVSNLTPPGATTPFLATTIWARADGVVAVAEADGAFAIGPGESLILDNGEPSWSQGLANVGAGTLVGGPILSGTPAMVRPMGTSLAGGIANPGTHVSIILDNGTGPTQVAVASND